MTILLPPDVSRYLYRDIVVAFIPAGVCKTFDLYRKAWFDKHITRIQRMYRKRIQVYQNSDSMDTLDMYIRMYMIYYPYYFLQRWPDLALRKCRDLTPAQKKLLLALPPTTKRTKRHVRDIFQQMTLSQIMYVGW